MPELIWTSRFDREVQNVFARLEDRNEGAGARFNSRVFKEVVRLEVHPRLMPERRAGVRVLPITSTPYCVLYRVESRGIVLHALVDFRQNPETIARIIREITAGLD